MRDSISWGLLEAFLLVAGLYGCPCSHSSLLSDLGHTCISCCSSLVVEEGKNPKNGCNADDLHSLDYTEASQGTGTYFCPCLSASAFPRCAQLSSQEWHSLFPLSTVHHPTHFGDVSQHIAEKSCCFGSKLQLAAVIWLQNFPLYNARFGTSHYFVLNLISCDSVWFFFQW